MSTDSSADAIIRKLFPKRINDHLVRNPISLGHRLPIIKPGLLFNLKRAFVKVEDGVAGLRARDPGPREARGRKFVTEVFRSLVQKCHTSEVDREYLNKSSEICRFEGSIPTCVRYHSRLGLNITHRRG